MVATDVDLTRPTLCASHSAILGLLTPSFLLARSAPCSPLVVNQRRAVVLNLLGSNSTTAVRRPGSTAPRLLAPAASRGGLTLAGCRSAPTPSRRRAPSRAEPRTGGELVGCSDFVRARPAPGAVLGHQRQSVPIRTLTGQLANGYRSHEAARVIPCRARAVSPDGRAPGR